MFQQDLTPHRYARSPTVLAIGWLSKGQPFPATDVDLELVESLGDLIMTNSLLEMRGAHICEFCVPVWKSFKSRSGLTYQIPVPRAAQIRGREIGLGSAEIWIPSPDRPLLYAAPKLIYHYVADHGYAPPDQFVIAAKLASRTPHLWNAQAEHLKY